MVNDKNLARIIVFCACVAGQLGFNNSRAEEASSHKPGAKIIDTIKGLPPGLNNAALNYGSNLIYVTGYNFYTGIGNLLVLDKTTHKVLNKLSVPKLNAILFVEEETDTLCAFSNNGFAPNGTAIQYSGRSLNVLKTIQT